MLLTIFTPTYNRGSFLPRIFESLKKQSFNDFEWLIIDDGSYDNTKYIVEQIKKEYVPFKINYIYKNNGGKHSAINLAANISKGVYMLWLDSDDIILDNSLDSVSHYLKKALLEDDISAIVALRLDDSGNPLGSFVPKENTDVKYLNFSQKNHVSGDYSWFIKTDILRHFPYPIYDNENFCTEGIVLNRISEYYKTRFVPISIIKGSYIEGGLTDRMHLLTKKNPLGFLTYYKETILSNQCLLKYKIRYSVLYWIQRFKCNPIVPLHLRPTLFMKIFKIPAYIVYKIHSMKKGFVD